MASLSQIREALAAAMSPLGCQVSGYPLANPTPPFVQVLGPTVQFDAAMGRGLDEWTFTIQAAVAVTNDVASAKVMDVFMDPYGAKSIKTVLEADTTLGGIVQDLRVERGQANQTAVLQSSGTLVLLGEWEVIVYVEGA